MLHTCLCYMCVYIILFIKSMLYILPSYHYTEANYQRILKVTNSEGCLHLCECLIINVYRWFERDVKTWRGVWIFAFEDLCHFRVAIFLSMHQIYAVEIKQNILPLYHLIALQWNFTPLFYLQIITFFLY